MIAPIMNPQQSQHLYTFTKHYTQHQEINKKKLL